MQFQIKDFQVDMRGAIDMHIHCSPEAKPRCQSYYEVAKTARDAGMRAVVLKPVGRSFPTMFKAHAAEILVPGIKVFGGIVLDRSVGGLNPIAVSSALQLGAKVVWMPLADAQNTLAHGDTKVYKTGGQGLSVLDKSGGLLPEVEEILDIMSKDTAVLSTTHLSPEESVVLVKEAKKRGVKNVIVDHANARLTAPSPDQQKELTKDGAYLELSGIYYLWTAGMPMEDPEALLEIIKNVGAEHCTISTDSGHILANPAVTMYRRFLILLMSLGVNEKDIELMSKQNPAKLLELQ